MLIACGVGYLIFHFVSRANRNKIYDEIKPTVERQSTETPTGEYVSPVDFDQLHTINEDIYAWITIPDTIIDYPIVQGGGSDDYYLDHTIEHAEGLPGSIYTRYSDNTKTFEDFNTLIYGHELADGTFFTPLHNYMDPEFFKTHRDIKIYLPDKEIDYKIFATVTYDDRLIPYYFPESDMTARQQFLTSLRENRYMSDNIADDITVTENDNIITLSTCIYDLPTNRYIVCAVKTGETPTK